MAGTPSSVAVRDELMQHVRKYVLAFGALDDPIFGEIAREQQTEAQKAIYEDERLIDHRDAFWAMVHAYREGRYEMQEKLRKYADTF